MTLNSVKSCVHTIIARLILVSGFG